MSDRRTIGASDNKALLGGVKAKNNGRYNGDGRHWATPPEVFDPLHREFNFTLDPCATPISAKCEEFFTEADNGLAQCWSGHRVFRTPPDGKEVYAWTRKAREEAAKGVLVVGLLPASCDLKWWHEDVVGYAEVRFIRGRVRFITGGPYRASGFFASAIAVWHPHGAESNAVAQQLDQVQK
jgi:phage N-6-adenine-methyltransferase